ncbi:hypothetical protein GCM10011571_20750 [Marinithermofilum abyssi]|uniref:Ribosomal processing cysteine protease Prp n=1 Tax=Marinithermofilum abyssi TaxID=1571185 RepID=A0A8J2VHV6_9BACL|nr:ribosomal-processing cysteine protease Prp [Marinithermofilum abyssi]GGE18676.1 hypothetical protein GCM10011571_20750 [Marinithermofilum abyssi]
MIRITVHRDSAGQLAKVIIEGHAHFAEYGSDIVCAAVSAISIGLANATEKLTGVRVYEEVEQEGKLVCRIPQDLSPEEKDRVHLLMEAMVTSLQSVAEEYGSYVRITEV